jgi:hypothetical protein
MAVYRFKVSLEENEDVYRDIDILASQSFEEFHEVIQSAYKFDSKHAASFFISDDLWRKGAEITLRKEDLPLEEEEIRKKIAPKRLMREARIAKFIEQPHQRFIYVFDPQAQWTFLVEMIRIGEENSGSDYPLIVRSHGTAPRQYRQIPVVADEEAAVNGVGKNGLEDEDEAEVDEKLLKVEEEELVEDEDINSLEGEEGEAEEDEDPELPGEEEAP